ncbi:MAG: hypothetical protein WCA77_02220, partial [Thermoplasmata archaeon]
LGAVQAGLLRSAEVKWVRWPGGEIADRFDPAALNWSGLIYATDGVPTLPASNTSQFVAWCKSISCQAIITVPAEVDEPSLASDYASYLEQTLDFFPAYWEIGNEPADWSHFGVPWDSWTGEQNITPTPEQYADVVNSYTVAIHSVDPEARIIGLGGVGAGVATEGEWINATMAVNGANLSAVAVHVYPAGNSYANESAAQVFATLNGPAALSQRIPKDRGDVAEDCSNCAVTIVADELGVGTEAPFAGFATGFGVIPFLAAEYVQGLTLNVTNLDYFTLQLNAPTALLGSTGAVQPVANLFTDFLPELPEAIDGSHVNESGNGLYALAGVSENGSTDPTILLVNTNTSVAYAVNLTASGFPSRTYVESVTWNSSGPSPITQYLNQPFPLNVVVPPQGLGLWRSESGVPFSVSRLGPPLEPKERIITNPTAARASGPFVIPPPRDSAGERIYLTHVTGASSGRGRKISTPARMQRRALIVDTGPREGIPGSFGRCGTSGARR